MPSPLLALHGFPKEFIKYLKQRLTKANPSLQKNSLKSEPLEKLDVEEENDSSGNLEEESVLDGLVSIILSQNTTDVNSLKGHLFLSSLLFPLGKMPIFEMPEASHIRQAATNMDQNSAISLFLSPTRRYVDYFSCDTPAEDKRLKLFGFEIDPYQKSTAPPGSERDESVSSSETVSSKANKNLQVQVSRSVDSSKLAHSRSEEPPKDEGNSLHSIELQKYKCEFCSKKFTNPQALGGHQNAHRKERLKKKGIQLQARRASLKSKILSFLSSNAAIYHHSPPNFGDLPFCLSACILGEPQIISFDPPSQYQNFDGIHFSHSEAISSHGKFQPDNE